MGTIKGVGRIYQQTFIDMYSRFALTKLYTAKTAIMSSSVRTKLSNKVHYNLCHYGG